MNYLRVTRLLPWLCLAVCPALLGHCGGATEYGTETGNPPVIEQQRIQLVQHPAGVEIVGAAGSVSPGASVRVTNQRTGQSAQVNARADGSLNVVVSGTLDDSYELSVTSAGRTQNATLRTTPMQSAEIGGSAGSNGSGNASGSGGAVDLDTAACSTLEDTLTERLSDSFAGSDHSCTQDGDCAYVGWGVECYRKCGGSILPLSGVDAARAAATQASADVCTELTSRCERETPPPCSIPRVDVECRAGQCQSLELGSLSCAALSDKINSRRGAVVSGADLRCTTNSDCSLVVVQTSACTSGCAYTLSVAASSADSLPFGLQQVDDTFCPTYDERGCPAPLALPCPAPGFPDDTAVCEAGQCTTRSALP